MIKNFKIEKFLIFIFSLLVIFFVNSALTNYKFNDLKISELSNFDNLPTLNGECIYQKNEIIDWINNSKIKNYEIVFIDDSTTLSEIGLLEFKCLGKISGSSLLQNYKIDSNIKNIDLVVYPTFLLSHLLTALFIISIRKKSISIDKDYLTFLFASSLLINQFSSAQIFFDSYSWILLMLITLKIKFDPIKQ